MKKLADEESTESEVMREGNDGARVCRVDKELQLCASSRSTRV